MYYTRIFFDRLRNTGKSLSLVFDVRAWHPPWLASIHQTDAHVKTYSVEAKCFVILYSVHAFDIWLHLAQDFFLNYVGWCLRVGSHTSFMWSAHPQRSKTSESVPRLDTSLNVTASSPTRGLSCVSDRIKSHPVKCHHAVISNIPARRMAR